MSRRIMVLIGLIACGGQAPRAGSLSRVLVVRVRSIGPSTDPDGYTLRVDGVVVLEGRWDGGPRRVGVLETARLIELGDLAESCEVVEGPAAIPLPAGPQRAIGVTWQVRCGQAAAKANRK